MTDQERKVAAKCRTCGEQLTVSEFQACRGIGHFCAKHLPSGAKTQRSSSPRPRRASSTSPGPTGSRRGRRISDSGAVEYSCKGQFAKNGVIRAGRLTSDHPASFNGSMVFVHNKVGYGPGEILTLFIKDPEGRALARRSGFECHD